MLRATKQWDVRCPRALVKMFPVRKGYYYKVTRTQARRIVAILARAYGIKPPTVLDEMPPAPNADITRKGTQSYIRVYPRAHMKSTFHEFYHHLDWETNGRYNSSDRQGGPSSLAWQFADRLFEVFRVTR